MSLWIINPMKGIVGPKKSFEVEVTFAPIDGIYKTEQTDYNNQLFTADKMVQSLKNNWQKKQRIYKSKMA